MLLPFSSSNPGLVVAHPQAGAPGEGRAAVVIGAMIPAASGCAALWAMKDDHQAQDVKGMIPTEPCPACPVW